MEVDNPVEGNSGAPNRGLGPPSTPAPGGGKRRRHDAGAAEKGKKAKKRTKDTPKRRKSTRKKEKQEDIGLNVGDVIVMRGDPKHSSEAIDGTRLVALYFYHRKDEDSEEVPPQIQHFEGLIKESDANQYALNITGGFDMAKSKEVVGGGRWYNITNYTKARDKRKKINDALKQVMKDLGKQVTKALKERDIPMDEYTLVENFVNYYQPGKSSRSGIGQHQDATDMSIVVQLLNTGKFHATVVEVDNPVEGNSGAPNRGLGPPSTPAPGGGKRRRHDAGAATPGALISPPGKKRHTDGGKQAKKGKKAKKRTKRSLYGDVLCTPEACKRVLAEPCGCADGSCLVGFRSAMEGVARSLDPDLSMAELDAASWKPVLHLREQRFCESYSEERNWLWEELLDFRVLDEITTPTGEKRHRYRLEYKHKGRRLCPTGWFRLAGFKCGVVRKQIPRRGLTYEAQIKRGIEVPAWSKEVAEQSPAVRSGRFAGTKRDVCEAWIYDYLQLMCCSVPALEGATTSGRMYYTKDRPGFEWMQYRDDIPEEDRLCRSQFNKIWRKQWKLGWTCLESHAHYTLEYRTCRARGFKKCEICENLDEELRVAIRQGKSREVRMLIREKKQKHLRHIKSCRAVYARHKFHGITKAEVTSSAMDAAAQNQHRCPITASDNPRLVGMEKLQMKITGVLVHGAATNTEGYYAVVTPPWLKTGANMSCTIMMALVAWGVLKGQRRWCLQVDGASDNIAYTVMYFCAWLLLASQRGLFGDALQLESIVLSRLPVGHTHIDIDQIFSVLARHLWGRRRDQLRALDIHSVEAFLAEITKAHKNLKKCVPLESCYDFDAHFTGVKSRTRDTGIKAWRVFEFRTDRSKPGIVLLRTKQEMDSGAWVDWRAGTETPGQFWPNGTGAQMPGASCPPVAALKQWEKKADVLRDLNWFMDKQTIVNVDDLRKRELREYINKIPATAADITAKPPWPAAVPRVRAPVRQPATDAAPARLDDPRRGAPPPEVRPLPAGGLSRAERKGLEAKSAAQAAFTGLTTLKKNQLVVFLYKGRLELGQAVKNTDLADDSGGKFELQYWMNHIGKGVPVEEQRELAERPPDFRKKFMKPKTWVREFSVDGVVVFMAGDRKSILTKEGSFRVGVKRRLSLIGAFPLPFSERDKDWTRGQVAENDTSSSETSEEDDD